MVSADRQLIMETNRSLRNIKTELENLLEKGVIDESVFDEIHASLPEESPLSGPLRKATGKGSSAASTAPSAPAPAARAPSNPAPAHRQPVVSAPPGSPPREQVLFDSSRNEKNGQNFHNPLPTRSPAPPSYEDTPPPQMPPPPRTGKPVVAWARALYTYNASDGRDCSFLKDDKIAVHEYMNQDWWMGQNLRTGQEGIFPRNYVFVEQEEKKAVPQQQYGYPPQQQNPYNSSVPPMAVAEGSDQQHHGQQGQEGENKAGEYGKKFGKKLGNAAIFGAGATLGGNLVNSIF